MENDYELVYLAKFQNNEYALNYLIMKYTPLIYRLLQEYNCKGELKEDLYQEGLEVIYNAIYSFDDNLGCPFYSYVKLLLQRRIIRVLYKEKNECFYELRDFDIASETNIYKQYILKKYCENISEYITNDIERNVFIKAVIYTESIDTIAKELNLSNKAVSNILYRAKQKIKNKV